MLPLTLRSASVAPPVGYHVPGVYDPELMMRVDSARRPIIDDSTSGWVVATITKTGAAGENPDVDGEP
jgi:hypothetical protein